jgi:hypothetical protein
VISLPKLVEYYVLADGVSVELDTQRRRILKHVEETKSEVIAEFSEHSNDKRSDLKELKKAVDMCRMNNAKLAVAAFDDMPRKFQSIMILLWHEVDCVVIRDQPNGSYAVQVSELIGEFWR